MRRIVLVLLLLLPVLSVEAIDISTTPLFLAHRAPLFIFVPDQTVPGIRFHLWDDSWVMDFVKGETSVRFIPTFYHGNGAPGSFSLMMRMSGFRIPMTDPPSTKPHNSVYYNPDITYKRWEGTDPPEPDADFCQGFESYGLNHFYTQLAPNWADPASRVLQYFTVPLDRAKMYPSQSLQGWQKEIGGGSVPGVVSWPAAYYHYLGGNKIEYRNILVKHKEVCTTPLPMNWNYNTSNGEWSRPDRPGETFSFPYAYQYNTVTNAVTTISNVPPQGYSYHPEGNLSVTFYRTPREEMQNWANWWRFWSSKFRIVVGSLGTVVGYLDPSIEVALLPHVPLERYRNENVEIPGFPPFFQPGTDLKVSSPEKVYPALDQASIQTDPMTVMPTQLTPEAVANIQKTLYQELYPIRFYSVADAWHHLGRFVRDDPTGAIWSKPCREVHGIFVRTGAYSRTNSFGLTAGLPENAYETVLDDGSVIDDSDCDNDGKLRTFSDLACHLNKGSKPLKTNIIDFDQAIDLTAYPPWPNPNEATTDEEIITWSQADFYHATTVGGGRYFPVRDFASIAQSLNSIIAVNTGTASGGGVGTSAESLGVGTFAFSTKFKARDWTGDLIASKWNKVSGKWVLHPAWQASTAVQNYNQRKIVMPQGKGSSSTTGVFFRVDPVGNEPVMSSDAKTLLLGHTPTTTGDTDMLKAIVKSISGKLTVHGPEGKLRERMSKIADIVHSKPLVVEAPPFNYSDPGYDNFKLAKKGRTPLVLIGTNGGDLRAFNRNTGKEVFAYIPYVLLPKLRKLTQTTYVHNYYVDGSPIAGDAYFNGSWHTMVIGTLRGGGKGFFGLDVTDPDPANLNTVVKWERAVGDGMGAEAYIGYNYGTANIVKLTDPADGSGKTKKWVAILGNGYNSDHGKPALLVVDLANGQITPLKVRAEATINGTLTTLTHMSGSGLSTPVIAVSNNNEAIAAYAGDLDGHLWRFDLQASNWQNRKGRLIFWAKDGRGKHQPITVRPEVLVKGNKRYIAFGTGRYLGRKDLVAETEAEKIINSMYVVKDEGVTNIKLRGDLSCEGRIKSEQVITAGGETKTVRQVTRDDAAVCEKGWFVDLAVRPTAASSATYTGERIVAPIKVIDNRIYFPTLIPGDQCEGGGTGWLMTLDAFTGNQVNEQVFDTNNDGKIDGNDQIVSGIRYDNGMPGDVEFVCEGGTCMGINTLTDGTVVTTLTKQEEVPVLPLRRQSWRQLK